MRASDIDGVLAAVHFACHANLMNIAHPEYMTADEVAALCDVSGATVRRWAALDLIECLKLPGGTLRFPVSGVWDMIERAADRGRAQQAALAAKRPAPATPATDAFVASLLSENSLRATDGTGCLLWTGRLTSHGYGIVRLPGRNTAVHRLAHEVWIGPIPPGLHIDHVYANGCRHKHCIEPAHLEPVTNEENIRRGFAARKTAS